MSKLRMWNIEYLFNAAVSFKTPSYLLYRIFYCSEVALSELSCDSHIFLILVSAVSLAEIKVDKIETWESSERKEPKMRMDCEKHGRSLYYLLQDTILKKIE